MANDRPVSPQHDTQQYSGTQASSHAETGGTGTASSMADTARAQAGAVWHDAKQKMRSTLDEQQRSAADGVSDFAGALRTAAGELGGKNKTTTAQFAQHAADGLESLAGALRTKDAATFMREAESFARRQPALFLGAAVAAGFLAVRFLKSSANHEAGGSEAARYGAPARTEDMAFSERTTSASTTEGEFHGSDYTR